GLVDEKVYEVLKPMKHPAVQRCSESFEIPSVSFSQEIPVASGQAMTITYNKNRCYLSVMFNFSTLEEFSLAPNPRPIVRSKEKDVFIQVSSTNGTTLTRFRIKFARLSDHASFVEFISFFVKVLPPSNLNTSSDFSQPLSVTTTN
ncbi:hypothetical protein WUBG_13689, partial [Wuchereria bancrofti]